MRGIVTSKTVIPGKRGAAKRSTGIWRNMCAAKARAPFFAGSPHFVSPCGLHFDGDDNKDSMTS